MILVILATTIAIHVHRHFAKRASQQDSILYISAKIAELHRQLQAIKGAHYFYGFIKCMYLGIMYIINSWKISHYWCTYICKDESILWCNFFWYLHLAFVIIQDLHDFWHHSSHHCRADIFSLPQQFCNF